MFEAYLTVLGVVLPVVETVPVWGPLLLAGMVAVPVRQRRAARRAVPGHGPGAVRTCADTRLDTDPSSAMTCADTCPDVSADTGAFVSGHEKEE